MSDARAGQYYTGIDSRQARRPRSTLSDSGLSTRKPHSEKNLCRIMRLLPPGAASARVDGGAPDGQRTRDGRLEVWFDLRPDTPRLLTVLDAAGRPLELLRSAQISARP